MRWSRCALVGGRGSRRYSRPCKSAGFSSAGHARPDDCVVAVVPYAALDRALIDGHREGFCKLIVSTETHRILGAHIMGEQELEILQLVATCIAADMQVEQLAEMELAYPTFTAIVGLAARRIIRELGIVPLAPQVQSLGRAYVAEWERGEV